MKNRVIKEILSYVKMIVLVVVLAWLLNNFIIINATIPSGSMKETIEPGDRVVGFRLSYLFSDPERGDIVVFPATVDEALGIRKNLIKRIIGLPGENVQIRDGKIYIDDSDTPLEEPYLPEEWVWKNDGYTFQIPEDSYLMMGDNRNGSKDARSWAEEALKNGAASDEKEAEQFCYVKGEKILGKAYFRYWPLTRISSLY